MVLNACTSHQRGGTLCHLVLCMWWQPWKYTFRSSCTRMPENVQAPSELEVPRASVSNHKTDRTGGSVGITAVTVICHFPAERGCLTKVLLFNYPVFWVFSFETNGNRLKLRAKSTQNTYSHSFIACFNWGWSQSLWKMPISSFQDPVFPVIVGWLWFRWACFID